MLSVAISATLHLTLLSVSVALHSSRQTEQCAICEMMLKLYSKGLFVSEMALHNYILINAEF